MPLERDGFREQLERLDRRFDGRETITLKEAVEVTGLSRLVLLSDRNFPAKKTTKRGEVGGKWIVSVVGLARWMLP